MDYGFSKELPESDPRQAIFAEQRAERGFDDTETWALDSVIVKFVLPRLKRFKELHICHPPSITMEEWDQKIQKMIDAFEEYERRDDHPRDWDTKKIDEGFKLFIEYFHDLWW